MQQQIPRPSGLGMTAKGEDMLIARVGLLTGEAPLTGDFASNAGATRSNAGWAEGFLRSATAAPVGMTLH